MIRLAGKNDAAQVAAIYRPFCEDNCISFEVDAPDEAEMASRIEGNNLKFPWLVDERDGRIAGYAYASPHRLRAAYRWSVEVTIYIHDAYRGRGVGRALYEELFERLRAQNIFKAYAGIVIPNPPSQSFHESMGFKPVAVYPGVGYKHGAWRDAGWWAYDIQPEVDSPAEPIHLSAITKPGT
jgi:L-amino acid N-acyltransferase YncA